MNGNHHVSLHQNFNPNLPTTPQNEPNNTNPVTPPLPSKNGRTNGGLKSLYHLKKVGEKEKMENKEKKSEKRGDIPGWRQLGWWLSEVIAVTYVTGNAIRLGTWYGNGNVERHFK